MLMLVSATVFGQVTGTVTDVDGPLSGVNVVIKGTDKGTSTDFDGKFSLDAKKAGELVLTYIGYKPVTVAFKPGDKLNITMENDGETLETIVITGTGVIDLAQDRKTPIAVSTVGRAEIQEKAQGNVEFPDILKNTPNVFVSNSGGGYGDSQMFTRGFDQTNTAFLLNGQPINGMEDGKMYWSNWSGMTDIANAVQVQRGLGASKLAISSVGGTINIVTKSTDLKEGGRIQAVTGNGQYYKGLVSYNTGLSDKGWAFSIALSHWQGEQKSARGTQGQGQSYFISVGKKINDAHKLNFLLTGAPQWHNQNFAKQFNYGNGLGYDVFGKDWNYNYGTLNGEKFTWRRNYYHKPVMNLNWDWEINDDSNLSTVLYASFGRGGGTGPLGRTNGFDAFRSGTASYYDTSNGDFLFDRLYNENLTVDSDGDTTNGIDRIGSYGNGVARRSSVNNHQWYGLISNYSTNINENLSFNFGLDGRKYTGDHFRQLSNLLGLNGYNDTYKLDANFKDGNGDHIVTNVYEADPWASLFNFAKDIKDKVAYNYSENINYIGAFGQIEYATDKFSTFFQGSLSTQSYQRIGKWAYDNEKSDKVNKLGFNVKTGFGYNLNDASTFFANAGYYSRQPFLDNIFENMRYSNDLIKNPEVENEKITGIEFGYKLNKKIVDMNINFYHTIWDNRTSVDTSDHLPDGTLGSYNTRRLIKQVHTGVEVEFFAKLMDNLKLKSHFTAGDWNIKGDYDEKYYDDQNGDLVYTDQIRGQKDEKVTRAPQLTWGLGLKYDISDRLKFDTDLNTYGGRYDRAAGGNTLLKSYALFDAGLSYKLKLGDKNVKLRANVNNLFNEQYYNSSKYGYTWAVGRTWSIGGTYKF